MKKSTLEMIKDEKLPEEIRDLSLTADKIAEMIAEKTGKKKRTIVGYFARREFPTYVYEQIQQIADENKQYNGYMHIRNGKDSSSGRDTFPELYGEFVHKVQDGLKKIDPPKKLVLEELAGKYGRSDGNYISRVLAHRVKPNAKQQYDLLIALLDCCKFAHLGENTLLGVYDELEDAANEIYACLHNRLGKRLRLKERESWLIDRIKKEAIRRLIIELTDIQKLRILRTPKAFINQDSNTFHPAEWGGADQWRKIYVDNIHDESLRRGLQKDESPVLLLIDLSYFVEYHRALYDKEKYILQKSLEADLFNCFSDDHEFYDNYGERDWKFHYKIEPDYLKLIMGTCGKLPEKTKEMLEKADKCIAEEIMKMEILFRFDNFSWHDPEDGIDFDDLYKARCRWNSSEGRYEELRENEDDHGKDIVCLDISGFVIDHYEYEGSGEDIVRVSVFKDEKGILLYHRSEPGWTRSEGYHIERAEKGADGSSMAVWRNSYGETIILPYPKVEERIKQEEEEKQRAEERKWETVPEENDEPREILDRTESDTIIEAAEHIVNEVKLRLTMTRWEWYIWTLLTAREEHRIREEFKDIESSRMKIKKKPPLT